MRRSFSIFLVTVQFVCLVILVIPLLQKDISPLAFLIVITGVALGSSAFYAMRTSKFHAMPDVDKKAILITSGPYKYIRNPMYSSLLIIGLGLVLLEPRPLMFIVYSILVIDLIAKSNYEEKLLIRHFSAYRLYIKSTYRLVPFIY